MKFPKGWTKYMPIGIPIGNTRIMGCKTPISKTYNMTSDFTPAEFLEKIGINRVGLVVDLTKAKTYYRPEDVTLYGAKYVKLALDGGGLIPSEEEVSRFQAEVSAFLTSSASTDTLACIHCTHGVNRTGFMICSYLIDVLGYEPRAALKAFNESRPPGVQRYNYRDTILDRNSEVPPLLQPYAPATTATAPRLHPPYGYEKTPQQNMQEGVDGRDGASSTVELPSGPKRKLDKEQRSEDLLKGQGHKTAKHEHTHAVAHQHTHTEVDSSDPSQAPCRQAAAKQSAATEHATTHPHNVPAKHVHAQGTSKDTPRQKVDSVADQSPGRTTRPILDEHFQRQHADNKGFQWLLEHSLAAEKGGPPFEEAEPVYPMDPPPPSRHHPEWSRRGASGVDLLKNKLHAREALQSGQLPGKKVQNTAMSIGNPPQ